MPPVFKGTKGYNPALAHQTLQKPEASHDEDMQSMLRELGIEDEVQPGDESLSSPAADTRSQLGEHASQTLQQLSDRTAATVLQLQQGALNKDLAAKAQDLLLDLQHQVELLFKGNASLRTSIKGMADTRHSKQAPAVQDSGLQQQLEHLTEQLEAAQAASLKQQQQEALLKAEAVHLRTRVTQLQGQVNKLHADAAAADSSRKEQEGAVKQQEQATAVQQCDWQQQLTAMQAQLAGLQEQLGSTQRELQSSKAAAEELQQQLSSKASMCQQLETQLKQAADQSAAAAAGTAAGAQAAQERQAELQQLQTQLAGLHEQLGSTQRELQGSKAAAEELQQQLHNKTSVCQQLEGQLKQAADSSAATAAGQAATAKAETESALQQLQAAQEAAVATTVRHAKELASLKAQQGEQLAAAQHAADEARQRAADLEVKCTAEQAVVKQLQKQLADLQELQQRDSSGHMEALQRAQEAVKSVEAELATARQQLEDKQKQLEAAQAAATSSSQEQQQQVAALKQQLQSATDQVTELSKECETLTAAQVTLQERCVSLEASTALLKQQEEMQKALLQQKAAQLAAGDQARRAAERQAATSQEALGALESKLLATTADAAQAKAALSQLQQELGQVRQEAEQKVAAAVAAAGAAQELAQKEAAAQVQVYVSKWKEEYEKRRKLHDMVVELKGNIRVLARIRPLLEKERVSSDGSAAVLPVQASSAETLLMAGTNMGQSKEYEFDRVFGPQEGQEQVFQEVSSLVGSVLDGYNVTIFAYGQTGAGKTFTMEGPHEDPGISTRALRELFRMSQERQGMLSCSFSASVLEIYNEQIFDLLVGGRTTGDKLDVKAGPDGMYVPGLRVEAVRSYEEVATVLSKGKQARSTMATNMNEHSSRSHLVLSLYATVSNTLTGDTSKSKLHLIDLAGSERVSRSGAEGDRLKEAAAINKSLSALGDVVAALQQRAPHVPYRNSKLTRLLEDALGGNSKTILVVNCSPAAENLGETRCSLDFAARARQVELGAAKRNTVAARPAVDSDGAGASPTAAAGSGAGGASGRDTLRAGAAGLQGSRLLAPQRAQR